MSKHVTEWLSAYLDNELKGIQFQQVVTHLVECQACRDELESLARISSLIREVPAPEFTSAERFAARVNLRLPQRRMLAPRNRSLEVGWWMVPVGLLGAWIFIGTTSLISNLLSVANGLGLVTGVSNWLVFGPVNEASWSATLGQVGVLSGSGLNWAAATEALTRTSLPQFAIHIAIASLYLSWMAIWWARRRRQDNVQLVEG